MAKQPKVPRRKMKPPEGRNRSKEKKNDKKSTHIQIHIGLKRFEMF